ncbi:Condensin complex subunit 3-like, partial [Homarus americanus]
RHNINPFGGSFTFLSIRRLTSVGSEMSTLKQIFTDCQQTAATHPKLVKALIKIYLKSDLSEFLAAFTSLLKKSLIHGDKQPSVERTLNFVAKFATTKKTEQEKKGEDRDQDDENDNEEEEADPFLVHLILFLLDNHEANSQAVRYRVCQLINKLLNHMGEEAVIDDDLYNNIYDTMLHRLQDKVPLVRVQAVLALARLQDPRNKECPVIKAYRYHMCMDPNPDVRRAVLSNIAITFQTLPDILERTRDVRDLVRRQAYMEISQKVHLRSLTIAQRLRLISEGLKDRNVMVRSCVEKNLIPSWLRMVNGNVLNLLACLDVEASVSEAELALKTIFRDVPFADLIDNFGLTKKTRVVNPEDLRPESAIYWRCLAQHLRNEGAEEALDSVLPELTHFCSYVHDYVMMEVLEIGSEEETAVRCMEKEFVTNQLAEMTMLYDLADEVGRRSLDQLVRTLLVSDKVGEFLMKVLVEVFGKLYPPTTRINQLAEIISEVREPVCKSVPRILTDEEKRNRKLQVARLKVKINQLREEVEECVRSLDLTRAQVLKEALEDAIKEESLIDLESTISEEVQEERKDPATLSKCLKIVCHMIESPELTVMTPTLHSLHENLILLCLRSEDPTVRNQGVQALGLCCLLSKDLAHQHLILFMQLSCISRIDVEQIQLTALRCVIDMLHLYGLEEFTQAVEDINDVNWNLPSKEKDKEEEYEGEGGVIISVLCQMMDADSVDVQTLAAEGLCKLLLSCRITSSKLISHNDSLMRHMLGVFFSLYASYGGSNQESLSEAVLPTLHTLFNAPSRSPLRDVDVDDVANFLVSITSPSIVVDKTNTVNAHDTLVFTLCTEILAFSEGSWTKVLIRCLNHLQLTSTNFSLLRQVDVLAGKMIKRVIEKVSLNAIKRFQASIQNLLKNAPEIDPESQEEKRDDTVAMAVDETSSPLGSTSMNKTLESTMESESEGSPNKRLARSPSSIQLDQESIQSNSPQVPNTQNNNEQVKDSSVRTLHFECTEVELIPEVSQNNNAESPDLFESLGSSSPQPVSEQCGNTQNQEESDELAETSTLLGPFVALEIDSSSSVSSGKRRSKHESSTGDSREEETISPSKVSRMSRMLNDRQKRVGRKSSKSSDFSQPSPDKITCLEVLDTSEDSSSYSGYATPPSRVTRNRLSTLSAEKSPSSDSKQSTPVNRSRKKFNSSELTPTSEDSSQSRRSARITRQKESSNLKIRTSAKNSSKASTTSEDTTPVRRSARIESSSTSTGSNKTPNDRRSSRLSSSKNTSKQPGRPRK